MQVSLPCPQLRPFVRAFAQRENAPNGLVIIEPVPAQLEQIVEFDFGTPSEIWHPSGQVQYVKDVSVAGSQTRFTAHMHLRAGVQAFGIFFCPTGFSQLFHVPMSELTNCVGEVEGSVKQSLRNLRDRLGETASFEERVLITETFLLKQVNGALAFDEIGFAANYIFKNRGAIRISELADKSSSGLRHFERKFLHATGATPKTFARIARFQGALDTKLTQPNRSWLDIAHSFGYHDQMHMIHDFEKLGRGTPTKLISEIGDQRPPALVAESHVS